MTRRTIQNLKPFAFQADFSAPPAEAAPREERFSVTAAELAALVSQARAEGAAEARELSASGPEVRLKASTEKLNAALADLVELARRLEDSAKESPLTAEAREIINRAASRIIDGQGDLFREECQDV